MTSESRGRSRRVAAAAGQPSRTNGGQSSPADQLAAVTMPAGSASVGRSRQPPPWGEASAGPLHRQLSIKNRRLAERLRRLEAELATLHAALSRATSDALTDPLTGLANRRAFDDALEATAANAHQTSPAQLLIADLDRFKALNDAHGHHFGDAVLCITGAVLTAAVRRGTLVARLGGDEFALLLSGRPSDTAATITAAAIAERLCARIAQRPLAGRGQPACAERVTLSIGVADCRPGDTPADWYARADAALYTAKRDGRDRVVVAPAATARAIGDLPPAETGPVVTIPSLDATPKRSTRPARLR